MHEKLSAHDLEQINALSVYELSLLSCDLKIGRHLNQIIKNKVVAVAQSNNFTDEQKEAIETFDLSSIPIKTYVSLFESSSCSLPELARHAKELLSEIKLSGLIDHLALDIIRGGVNTKHKQEFINLDCGIFRIFNLLDARSIAYSVVSRDKIKKFDAILSVDGREELLVNSKANVEYAVEKSGNKMPRTGDEMIMLLGDHEYTEAMKERFEVANS